MNTHQQIEPLLAYYRELPDYERTLVDKHLTHCRSCARKLDTYRQMDQDLAQLMKEEQSNVSSQQHRQQRVAFYTALDKENQSIYHPLFMPLLQFTKQGVRVLLLVLLAVGLIWIFQTLALDKKSPESANHSLPIATPQQVVVATFGEPAQLELKGYDVEWQELAGGEQKMRLMLHWQILDPDASSYAIFGQLLDSSGRLHFQKDQPIQNNPPPTTWQAGEIVITPLELILPTFPTLPEGPYSFVIGIYDPDTGMRLPVQQDGTIQPNGQVTLMEIN